MIRDVLIWTEISCEMEHDFISGFEFSIDDKPGWDGLVPLTGQVVEVHMNSTSLTVQHDSWAGFFIDKVELQPGGSVTLHVRLIGAEDQTISGALASFSASGRFGIHLCRSRPCAEVGEEQEGKLHVTRLKLFEFSEYIESADYVSATQKRLAKGWSRYLIKKKDEERLRGEVGRGTKPALPKDIPTPPDKKQRKVKTPKVVPPEEGRDDPTRGAALTEELKNQLKEKLKKVKSRVVPSAGKVATEIPSPTGEDSSSGQGSEDTDSVQEMPKLSGGTSLLPLPPVVLETAREDHRDHALKKAKKLKKKKKSKDAPEQEDTKDTISKSARGQLVQRAVLASRTRKATKKQKRKKTKGDSVRMLSDALTKILTKSSSSKKTKRRKRYMTAEGVIESCSDSSTNTSASEEDEGTSSDQDLETPMRKRSRDRPGSVLQLLTDHVRDQLQQSATTEVGTSDSSLTSGVKVMTYFMLQLRPHFQGHQREMRELRHLSACIDALRRGDVATTGDALAGRFIALHQSMIDQNWHTAKHMEIFPMEETSAANTALPARKHSKLVAKAQGLTYTPTWNPRGKGRGRGDWSQWNDSKGDAKGEKGKSKKGKGKGRGKPYWGDGAQGGDWKDKKERPEEKTS